MDIQYLERNNVIYLLRLFLSILMVNSNLNLFYDRTKHNKTNKNNYPYMLSGQILKYNILIRYSENINLNCVYNTYLNLNFDVSFLRKLLLVKGIPTAKS